VSARDDILSAIRARRTVQRPHPPAYRAPEIAVDPIQHFADRATAQAAEVHLIESLDKVPAAVAEVLRAKNMAAAIHLPPDPHAQALTWSIETDGTPPGPNSAALSFAPFAVAETGTLVHASAAATPASWHFRPGLEIAIIEARNILPHLEDVLARLKRAGADARTINLVTGPSRTGDIEQTLELGAHGPKSLVILIVQG